MKHFVDVIQSVIFSKQNSQEKFQLKEFKFKLSKYFNIGFIGNLKGYLKKFEESDCSS